MKRRIFKYCTITLMLLLALGTTACGQSEETTSDYNPDYLVLVNKDNLISEDFIDTVQLCDIDTVYDETNKIEEATKKAFESLQSYLKDEGVEIGVDSVYRSIQDQQDVMDEFIEKYGEDYAKKTVAIPGTSEHHTGLAVDLVPKVNGEWVIENEDMLKETEIFEKIHAALPQFGFILRYPKDKASMAGFEYEPWHIRYVGKDVAQEIYEKGLTLEEYLSDK